MTAILSDPVDVVSPNRTLLAILFVSDDLKVKETVRLAAGMMTIDPKSGR